MKSITSTFLVIVSVVLLGSCRPEPEPCFRVIADTVFVGEPVPIENCSEKSERFVWRIEHRDDLVQNETNLTELTEESPKFTWYVPGTYNVSLTAFSRNDNKSSERSKAVIVYDRCFTCTRSGTQERSDTVQTCSSITFFNDNLDNFPTYVDSGFTCTVRTLAP